MKIRIRKIECKRCWHIWTPRKRDVRRCPKCQSVYFDVPKKIKTGGEDEHTITQRRAG